MTLERTLSIIKPDAVEKQFIGAIATRLIQSRLAIVAMKMVKLTREQAEGFYQEHSKKPFFPALIDFMTSGPVVVQVLEGKNAIAYYRDMMGATDPSKAAAGTLRFDFASGLTRNAVHGSDSEQSAHREIAFFFSDSEIYPTDHTSIKKNNISQYDSSLITSYTGVS